MYCIKNRIACGRSIVLVFIIFGRIIKKQRNDYTISYYDTNYIVVKCRKYIFIFNCKNYYKYK